MKYLSFLLLLTMSVSCQNTETDERTQFFPTTEELVDKLPAKSQVWVFLMAGQSNMAGRGLVEPQDTISHSRILTINKVGKLIVAKEPLHFYEPSLTGLDCGLSFGKALLSHIPDSVSILLIPTAVGGSSISQWLGASGRKIADQFQRKSGAGTGIRTNQSHFVASGRIGCQQNGCHAIPGQADPIGPFIQRNCAAIDLACSARRAGKLFRRQSPLGSNQCPNPRLFEN